MATFPFIIQLLLVLPWTCATASTASKPLGFSIALTHRDSPTSPLYDPSSTPAQRAEHATLRSRRRSRRLNSPLADGKISSSLATIDGEYLIQLWIGTPSRPYWLIMDTGSDLSWVVCSPCRTCFNDPTSSFEPQKSASYRSQSCSSRTCPIVNGRCNDEQLCIFRTTYYDGSSVGGILGSEAVAFDDGTGPRNTFHGVTLGCVHDQSAPHPSLLNRPGLVGLGRLESSLVNQIGPFIDHRFAYCMPPVTGGSSGWIKFGSDADEYFGEHMVQVISMGQIVGPGASYTVMLEGISVGNDMVYIQWRPPKSPDEDTRRLVVDSGAELTFLAPYVYDQVKEAVERAVGGRGFISDNLLCYHVKEENPYEGLPEVTLHFYGADWKLLPPQVFRFVRGTGRTCLGIHALDGEEMGILGSLAQQNTYVKYDLGKNLLSFAPMDCNT